jgi:hypothetical protein
MQRSGMVADADATFHGGSTQPCGIEGRGGPQFQMRLLCPGICKCPARLNCIEVVFLELFYVYSRTESGRQVECRVKSQARDANFRTPKRAKTKLWRQAKRTLRSWGTFP